MSIESVMPSNSSSVVPFSSRLQSFPEFPMQSILCLFQESVLHIRWPKYWSFSFSISPSNEYSGLISFRIDWLDLLAVQGTLKSLLQQEFKSINSLALSFLYSPTVYIVQLYSPICLLLHSKSLTFLTSPRYGQF